MLNKLINFYQNLPSYLSPEIVSFGGFSLRWYSVSYIVAILLGMAIIKRLIAKKKINLAIKTKDIDDFLLYLILGIFLGGRLFYVLIYNFTYFISNPLEILLPFSFNDGIRFTGISGLSFHGGVVGVVVALYYFSKKRKFDFFKFADLYCLVIPIGYTFGRLGNFMNGELYGRITSRPWGMYFEDFRGIPFEELRHPSQLYEAFGEGILLFVILWNLKNRRLPAGFISGFFLIGYGAIRFLIEFFRQPDKIFQGPNNELGTVVGFLSMGQVLCLLMVLGGSYVVYEAKRKRKTPTFL